MNETTQAKIRSLVMAIISAIMLIVFLLPMLLSVYRGLRPPPRQDPTPASAPSFQITY